MGSAQRASTTEGRTPETSSQQGPQGQARKGSSRGEGHDFDPAEVRTDGCNVNPSARADSGAAAKPHAPTKTEDAADEAWAESLRVVMRQVIASLPDHATLGELVEAAQRNPAVRPVLDIFTIQELIETAKTKPKPPPARKPSPRDSRTPAVQLDAEGNPVLEIDAGPKVIRRRADVPDGDLRVLRALGSKGPLRETDLVAATLLTSEQLRMIVRHLRTKGYVHIEGSGPKRRVKITRNGNSYRRKHNST